MSDNFYIFLNLIYSKYTWELLQQFPAKKKVLHQACSVGRNMMSHQPVGIFKCDMS